MYIDASAILAILLEEPDAAELASRIDASQTKLITSPVSVTEATLRHASHKKAAIEDSQDIVLDMLKTLQVQNVSITPEIGNKAVRAYALYGKGTGHPAKLNLGDVFSYACAKNYGVPLLYKGNDFGHTDLA